MVLTIAALDSAGKVGNWILGRADLRLRFPAESAARFPPIVGVCVRIRSGADQCGQPSRPTAGDGSAVRVLARTDGTAQIRPSRLSL